MQNYIVSVDPKNVSEYIKDKKILIAIQRKSRIKCKQLAILELLQLLVDFEPQFINNGPLGDVKGSITIAITYDERKKNKLEKRLEGAGYTSDFYFLFFDGREQGEVNIKSINPLVWKGNVFTIELFLQQDIDLFRSQAPDKRLFLLKCGDGIVREIKGYRGDGTEFGKRALPVEDCRMLLNLSANTFSTSFIDPFCGAGGIIYQAKFIYPDLKVFSNDISEELQLGLEKYGAKHSVGLAENIVSKTKFDSISTEVPFSLGATESVVKGLMNVSNYLSEECKIAIMSIPEQVDDICKGLESVGVFVGNVFNIDRKGTNVSVILAFKSKDKENEFHNMWNMLKLVY